MKQTVTLFGAKRSKGTMQDGKPYDSTKIYVQTAMNDSVDTVGFAVTEYNWGDSNNFYKIRDLTYPFQADITIDLVTNGKSSKLVVLDVEPITKPTKA